MRRISLLVALVALVATALNCRAAALPFPQAESDLSPDPAVTYGTLPNGVRYAVMPNHEPKGRVSLRLLVLAGSFEEKDNQQGLAHFLEHMAFNGSTHYPPGTLVEKLQRLGMGFGADTNAATSFDHTIYQLELPDTKPATLAEGVQILADYGGGLLLLDKMVDKERGIILSEKRERDSVGYRGFVSELGFLEAGTRVPARLPIGQADIIEKANRDPFVDFYNTWYRPERLVVIAVGDIETAPMVQLITDDFAGLQARAPEAPLPDMGSVATAGGVQAFYHFDPEAPDTTVALATVAPYAHEPDNTANRIKYLPRYLAIDMLNQRLDILAKKDKSPIIRAVANVEESFNLYRQADITATCKPENWTRALAIADQELRRALNFGFQPQEFKEAVANFRTNVEQAAKTAATRRSNDLAGDIADNLVEGGVFTSPADDLRLYGAALDKVSAADCAAALKAAWASPGRYVYVGGNARVPGVADEVIKIAYSRANDLDVRPPSSESPLSWGYSDFGAAGTVATRHHIADLDFDEVTFANGVRLNVKKTAFQANQIHILARLGSGQLTEPAATKPGLSTFTSITFTGGGLAKHTIDDLQHILAGRTVQVSFQSTPDAFVLEGDTNQEDLGLEFEYLAASISAPGYHTDALRVARKKIETAYTSFQHTERGPQVLHVANLLASGDPRFGLPPESRMLALTLDDVRDWLAPELAHGALEISVVGDADPDKVIAAAARTVGTLPARAPRPALPEAHQVHFPAQPFTEDYGIDSAIPKGVVVVYWPTTDGLDIHRARRLNILGEVLTDRLRIKVREQLGGSYAPRVLSTASDVFPGYGYLTANVGVEPSRAKEIEDVIVAVAADVQAHGITADELTRALNPTLTAVTESERDNTYWLTVLGRAQEQPETLNWARDRHADFASISKEDIDALARRYLGADHASRVLIRPKPRPAPTAPAAPRGPPTPTPSPPPDGG